MSKKQQKIIQKLKFELKPFRREKEISEKWNDKMRKYDISTLCFCPSCRCSTIINILQDTLKSYYPAHLKKLLNDDASHYCLNCKWQGIIVEI